MDPIYRLCIDALDEAGWPHSEPNTEATLGTQQFIDDVFVNASLRVLHGSVVRVLAFGAVYPADEAEDRAAVDHLLGWLNPRLDAGSFEVDDVLGVVCRCAIDLGGLVDGAGAVRDPAGGRATVMALVARAVAQFSEHAELIETVIDGVDPDRALAALTIVR
jgi:hypothetical protein